ncbi:aspartate/glutamate racemase family protein (plasmid) [Aquamicrobium terrae]
MKPLLLINPNTNFNTTTDMTMIARRASLPGQSLEGVTVKRGAPLIHDEEMLSLGATAVLELVHAIDVTQYSGLIIAAFGDPGLDELRQTISAPVTGIAEAGILEAARGERRFSIVTTTPRLVSAINIRVERYGCQRTFAGIRLTDGDVNDVMSDPVRLERALAEACDRAIVEDGAEAIVIGGGPLAVHAEALQKCFSVNIIEPVPAAVRLANTRAYSGASLDLQTSS